MATASKSSLVRMAAGTVKIERLNIGPAIRHKRPRFPRGGPSGSTLKRGYLKDEIPAEDKLRDCITLLDWNPATGWYDESETIVGGINLTFTPIRGDATVYTAVWGVLRVTQELTDPEAEESEENPVIDVTYLEVIHFQHSSLPGHVTTTPDGVSQMPRHVSGSNAYQLDGGPCGECS